MFLWYEKKGAGGVLPRQPQPSDPFPGQALFAPGATPSRNSVATEMLMLSSVAAGDFSENRLDALYRAPRPRECDPLSLALSAAG